MDQIIRKLPQRSPDHPEARILTCAFTGYRPQKMPFGFNEEDLRCVDLKRRLRCAIEVLIWRGCSHFITGGALGFDTFAAEAVMNLRRKYPWITLEIAIPYDGQEERWNSRAQDRYSWIVNQADIVTWVSHAFTRGSLAKRNCYLVDRCDLLIAAYDGLPGGTEQTVNYAKSRGKEIWYLQPSGPETKRDALYAEGPVWGRNAALRSACCG